jgi:pimeloyl-ACP methyl ester carboxylesterase
MDLPSWREEGKRWLHRDHPIVFHEVGAGPALLLIHGFPTCSWDWHRIWETLASSHRLVAADMIGFGLSAKPRDHLYSIFDQADLHEGLLVSLDVERVHILAHDYGDTVAQELLARFVERRDARRPGPAIESVCFLNGGLFPEAQRPLPVQKLLAGPLGGLLGPLVGERTFRRSFRRIFGPRTRPSRRELAEHWSLLSHGDGRKVVHRILRYLHERGVHRQRWVGVLQRPPVPLRFVVGLEDPVSGRAMARRYRELVPDADVVELPGVGHYPQLESPAELLRIYREFLRS